MKRISNVSKLKLLEFLNRVDLFKALSPRDRNEIAHLPNLVVMIEKDEVFIKRGEYDSSFYILLSGEASVTVKNNHIANVGPGHFIGEVGFICNEPRSATVTSLSEIIGLRITKDLFDKLPVKVRIGIESKIIAGLVERVTEQNKKIVDLEDKVAIYEGKNDDETDEVGLSDSDAADLTVQASPKGASDLDEPKPAGHRLDIKVPD